MSGGNRYVLDANIFIEASRSYYGFDICPAFWHALLRHHGRGRVCSIDKVKQELVVLQDRLSAWVNEKAPDTLFKATADKAVADAFRKFVNWVQAEQQFTLEAKAEFSSVADGWRCIC